MLRAGEIPALLFANPLTRVSVERAKMLENMRENLKRGLPMMTPCRAHRRILSIAGGGPSLRRTYADFEGIPVAVNGSLKFLLDRDVRVWACGVLDPGEHMVNEVVAEKGIKYFVASIVDPSLLDHLSGCDVELWHPGGGLKADEVPPGHPIVSGGSTMGVRWITLGYMLGFRQFDIHGLDSSYRGDETHAYPDRRDGKRDGWFEVDGYQTSLNFLHQVGDFMALVELFQHDESVDPISVNVRGDGLLQHVWEASQCST